MVHRRSPNICVAGRIHRPMLAKGMGSVLLEKGGAGGASSYPSEEQYKETTGRSLGGKLSDKLSKLIVKPLTKKPKNISFDM
jgi:hypothetical protein